MPIHDFVKVLGNVKMDENSIVESFCIIGEVPIGKKESELPTVIGENAFIRSHSVIYAGNTIGNNFQTGHGVLVRECNQIGNHVSIGTHSIVEHDVIIGNNVRIHSNVFIPEYSVLEDDVWIGPGAIFTNARYPRSIHVKDNLVGPTIKKGAIIGAGAIILPGVIVGENALVGAGAVVLKDVPAGKVVVGNPARIVNSKNSITDYKKEE